MRLATTTPPAPGGFVPLPKTLHPAKVTKLEGSTVLEDMQLGFDVDVSDDAPEDALERGVHGTHVTGFETYAAGRDFQHAVDAAAKLSRAGFGEWGAAGSLAAVVQAEDGSYLIGDTIGYVEDEDITFGAENLTAAYADDPSLVALVGYDTWADLRS